MAQSSILIVEDRGLKVTAWLPSSEADVEPKRELRL
jgi:hypothetical protein